MFAGDGVESPLSGYGSRSREYIEALGDITHAAAADVLFIERWARTVEGVVFDVGCGPGQWTDQLTDLGVEAVGIDPVAEFIDSARARWPDRTFRVGRAESLGVAAGTLGGILAWYSLIHMTPEEVKLTLAEFARSTREGGQLALGFFRGDRLERFEHAVATAYFWPVHLMEAQVESAGFVIKHVETRTDPGARPHAAIVAMRV